MKPIIDFFRKNLLIWMMYSVLFICLFLGDGKQEIVDVVGLGFVITLFIVARISIRKQREMPRITMLSWFIFLLYLSLRSIFSDEVGFSLFVTLRYFDAFLLYYVFSCYSVEKNITYFYHFMLGFSALSLLCSVSATLFPSVAKNLPLMNLLIPTYGHIHIVDILLFGFPLTLFFWFNTRKPIYLLLTILYFVGTVFSFARAALFFEAVILNLAIFYYQIVNKKISKITIIFGLLFAVIATIALVFPYRTIQTSKFYLPKTLKQPDVISSRLEFTKQALFAIKEHPIFGSGPGTFSLISRRFQNGPERYSWYAHNYVVETIAETGFVGFLLLCFVIFTLFKNISIYPLFSYGVLGTVFLYGLVDFSLNYLVVWFLFWSLLGISKAYRAQSHVSVDTKSPAVVWFAIICVSLGYIILLSGFIFDWSPTKILLFQEANQEIQKNTLFAKYIPYFHKNNPDILSALYRSGGIQDENKKEKILSTAISLDPHNIYLYNDLFQQMSIKGKYEQLWSMVKNISCMTGIDAVCEKIQSIPFSPELENSLINTFNNSLYGVRNDYSAIYYYLGYHLLSTNPQLTRIMWELSTRVRPDTGHYFIERASLERYVYNNEKGVTEILLQCQQNISSQEECRQSVGKNLPTPGSFIEFIQNYL